MDNGFSNAELHRRFHSMVVFGTVVAVDYHNKRLKLQEGADDDQDKLVTGWIPFPAESGRNYKRWRPVKLGQQFTALCRDGDPVQGRIVGESWWDDNDSPSTDKGIDVIEFENGNRIEHNITDNTLTIIAKGGMEVVGDIRVQGQIKSTGDQVADGVSQINHIHEKTASHPISKSGKPDK